MSLLWTARDLDIAETLARRVLMLSIDQMASIWWPRAASLRVIRRRLLYLAGGGLIARTIVNVAPPPEEPVPLFVWQPGAAEPDFTALAVATRSRDAEVTVPHEIFCSTKLAANLFGSWARGLPELHCRAHELALGQVYTIYRQTQPNDALRWASRSAQVGTEYRTFSPDAFIGDASGSSVRVVHRAARWAERQVERFHDFCAQSQLPYELW